MQVGVFVSARTDLDSGANVAVDPRRAIVLQ
jgi:hypothetical protein